MNKKFVIFLIIIVLCFGIFTYVYSKELEEDVRETKKVMNQIKEEYKKFNSSVQAFASKREEYYTYRENTYLEGFAKNTAGWNKLMDDYKETVIDAENNSKFLGKNCNRKYSDATVNNDCTQYKANLEALNNYYITDMKGYNKVVKEYNEYAIDNNYSLLKKVSLDDMKYIDLDNDGKYFGKENVK